jgi:hypothetical protein
MGENYNTSDSAEYKASTDINSHKIVTGLARLTFFNDNPFLRMQAQNIAIIDSFIMDIEKNILNTLLEERRISPQAAFLSAQTQMWIFAAYELMRTWRQRARELLTLAKKGKLQEKLNKTKYSGDFHHFSEGIYARQAKELLDKPEMANTLENDLRVNEIPFTYLEMVRMPLAKHEVCKEGSPAYTPGYARICKITGSLEYEIGGGFVCLGSISRRTIADSIRGMASAEPPTLEEIQEFRMAMKVPNMKELEEILS